jgi:hypothetical protein
LNSSTRMAVVLEYVFESLQRPNLGNDPFEEDDLDRRGRR